MLPVWILGVGFRVALKPDPRWLAARWAPGRDRRWRAGRIEDTVHGPTMRYGYSSTVFFIMSEGVKVTVPSRGIS